MKANVQSESARSMDGVLLLAVVALLGLGLVMVYSASAVFAARNYEAASYFLRKQALWMILGVGALWFGARADFSIWRRAAAPLLLCCVALLGLCLVPGIGARVGGATRWLRLGPLTLQPSEIAKFALVAYLASVLARRVAPEGVRQAEDTGARASGLFAPTLITALLVALVLVEPDLGTSVLLAATAFVLYFVAGARTSYLALGVLLLAPIGYQKLIVGTPWRLKRMLAFLDPWAFRKDVGYQISESLISVGSGGLHGMGLGQGKQKLFFLPEAHTDFILAIIGEELGFIGIVFVASCFALLLWRGIRIALRARDLFGAYLAFGITCGFLFGATAHMGVVLGLLPTKGTTLPFISSGGSALCMSMLMVGVLLNISAGRPEPASIRIERGQRVGNRRLVKPQAVRA